MRWFPGLLAVVVSCCAVARGQTDTTFTYQGALQDGGAPASGAYDIEVSLWDAPEAGMQVGQTLVFPGAAVVDGALSLALDFGAGALQATRWLELRVNGVTLSPRQPVTRAPYAIQTRGIFVDEEGKVGLGVAAPLWRLHVEAADGEPAAFVRSRDARGLVARTLSPAPLEAALDASADATSGTTIGVHGNVFSPRGFAGYFTGVPGSASYFRRRVGIGVDEPRGQLHIGFYGQDEIYWTDAQWRRTLTLESGAVDLGGFGQRFGIGVSADQLWLFRTPTSGGPGTGPALYDVVVSPFGAVGIGATSPQFLLHVNGTAGKPGGGSWSVASDVRLKKNVRSLEGALDGLLRLRGVQFEYLDAEAINERPGVRIGMVAQEVETVFPDWIDEQLDGYKAITYRGFEALTVEALRELRQEKDAEIAQLRAENTRLRDRLERLEAALSGLLEGQPAQRQR